jgi:hypothetical protein
MNRRGKFDTYTEFWRNVERARKAICFARKDRELITQLWQKGQQELERTMLDLCSMCCPK